MQEAQALVAAFEATLPFALDPFQREAMVALAAGHSVLVAAPTGTGKTVVAEFGVHLAHGRGQRALYTTPIKALSNQKYRDFRERYGDAVGLLTGDLVVEPDAAVQVMTTEVLRNRLVQGTDALDDVGAIVFDEVHYMGDPERGTAWEESILLAPHHIPLICLSATVPNTEEIASWIRDAHGELTCVIHDERAVPLEIQYFLDGRGHLVLDEAGQRHAWFPDVGGELGARIRYGGYGEGDGEREARPLPPPWQVVRYLESHELTPAIYFLFGRRACEQAAESCLGLKPVPHAAALVQEARARLAVLPPEDRNLRQVALLFRLLPRGVAVHHAGLLPPLKLLVEELFAAGRLRAVFATDTLALGINMPARTVVVGEMTKWDGEQRRLLTPNEFRQMAGRAGRRGLDARGVALVLYSPWVSFERSMEIASGELLPLRSAFRPSYSTTINLWRGPADEERLADLYARSLRRFQHDQRLHHLADVKERLQEQFEALQEGDPRDPAVWAAARNLARAEHALNRAHALAGREARAMVEGLARVLERFGYLNVGRPTWKAAYLRRLFGDNALTLAELLTGRYLEPLAAAEVAEVASWFSWDRDTPVRGLPIPTRLYRLRTELRTLHGSVLAEELRQGVEVSRPLYEEFHGVALAWAQGWTLKEIAVRTRIAEGDLVGHFQKALDLLGQLRNAARQAHAAPTIGPARGTRRAAARGAASEVQTELLVQRLEEADELLRRGVVAASYQWAIEGPPDAEAAADADWVPPPLEDEEPAGRRGRGRSPYPDGTARARPAQGRGRGARRAAKGTSGGTGTSAPEPGAGGGRRTLTWQRPATGRGKAGGAGGRPGQGTGGASGPARGKPGRRRRGR
ncbi:MAG TPA: DEAD/DEAH box helicase [Chloroflexota bacterium]|nr:DEAD/DEAH box helicase [Chloroflexota bacterium]